MKISRRGFVALPAVAALVPTRGFAAAPVKIGCLFPLTGNSAAAGQAARAGIMLATDIINKPTPDMAPLTLAAGAGLTGLGGAQVQPVFADHQGSPSVAQSDALRMITQEKVAALCGCYQSNCTLTASAVAERYGVPFLTGGSVAANLTERGYKWFFRTTPIGPNFGTLYMDFLAAIAKNGVKISKIAIVHENTDYGTSVAQSISEVAQKRGTPVSLSISYSANGTDVSPQVLQLKQANPDVVIFISYTSDSILYMKTFHDLDYKPPVVIGDDAGFSDPSFAKTVGTLAQGVLDRSAFVPGKPGSLSYKMNELYKQKVGRDIEDTTARIMEGYIVLCDAINRAKSTDPDKIRAALAATDIPASEVMLAYKGVKFDSKGQNTLGYSLIMQLQNSQYVPVWPSDQATAKLQLPFKGWS